MAIASQIKSEVAVEVTAAREAGYTPGLAVVLVGENPASQIYVRSKVKTCGELGIYSEMHTPPASISTEDLLALVQSLNARDEIDGILIQLPLPDHVDASLLLEAVDPRKDVDGFHPINAGRLLSGAPSETVLAPCTPAGIIEILERSSIPVAGTRAVVLGRSNIVGKPIAAMLINASATVTVCHSRTRDLHAITREADILVAAIGRAGFVHRDMVKPGATVVDVGINRLTGEAEFARFFPPEHPDHHTRRQGFDKRGS
ncbi:MAG TPA: bifunctional 5,10-methylenetetrahydrofolate dehydrogenase/5,10-methenyltetrahydrofolate cyclohydrolase, partial [Acidobacteriaceae bacterium]|nr:bifunctional 5,10-methylenetetrahydrofolate dehydrogenase/5,10-methenyltetrahydrofolate cyclohydrolase [Acidobacteriaceae bacterium]